MMGDLLPVSIQDQIAEAERELKMREKVYPRQVEQRLMTQKTADLRISLMKAIIETLKSSQGSFY